MSCGYKIGKLKNFVYLIKDLEYKEVDYKVYITKGSVYKLNADLVTFNESESFEGRFKFKTSVVCRLNRIFDDTLLRENNFKIVVEDWKGMQFLVSPEFEARYTSEYNIGEAINYELTFSTLSNIPTKIIQSKIKSKTGEKPICAYNNSTIKKLQIKNQSSEYNIDFLTVTYNKIFNGAVNAETITFTIPIEDNNFHYDLIKFNDNIWDATLSVGQDKIICKNLVALFNRQTTESFDNNKFTITLKNSYSGTLQGNQPQQIQYRWVPTTQFICDGFSKYLKEEKQQYVNGAWESVGLFRKGILIENNSKDCGYTIVDLYRWLNMDKDTDFVCLGTNKHYKQKELISTDNGVNWTDTGKYRTGDLIETDSTACGYQQIDWREVPNEFICEEYDPSVTWVLLSDSFYCEIKNI